jgi:Icc-related predicted phosphoesterase
VIRLAAVGDVHVGADSAGLYRPHWDRVSEQADVFLLAGDLTRHGEPEEAAVLAGELRDLGVPVVAVLGNHDYQSDRQDEIRKVLEDAGAIVLEGESTVVDVHGTTVGIAGSKGFGGGFVGACASDFGEPEMKAFVRHTKAIANNLQRALAGLDSEVRVALLHFSPVEDTLVGERLEIYPFLGSYLLAEAVDSVGAHLVLHGHAHGGSEKGITAGGVPVRNVAQPVIGHAYHLYCLGGDDQPACEP